MTERGLPIVDGAPACPFVAFEDDRDERAASPDHRHRCFAEPQPAPRALAHQEAYCLSSAFPVCPTFQDWARREAARSRGEQPRESDVVAPNGQSQRNPPRNWAAPPPWSSRGSGRPRDGEDWEDDAADDAPPDVPRRGRGLSGSYADRVASDPPSGVPGLDPADFGDEEELEAGAAGVPVAPPSAGPAAVDRGAPRAALIGNEPAPPRAPVAGREAPSQPSDGAPDPWDDEDDDFDEPPPITRRRERDPGRVAALGTGVAGGGPGGDAGSPRRSAPDNRPANERRREPRREPRREAAPEWERARPMEAYPTLRARRLPELSIPPLLVGVVALALAAAVLFALPGLLGFGNPSAGGSPTPSTPIRTPIVTQGPTPIPQPTQQLYLVQPGDTMSRIAGRFGIPLADLIAANAENIPNPDALQIGDQVIIPAPPPNQPPAASEIPAAS